MALVATAEGSRVHPLTRVFAYALIVAVLIPPLTDTERWPFTTLRLFSFVRGPVQAGWELTLVSADGRESPFPWSELPDAFHFRAHVLRRFPSMTETERRDACDAWASAVRETRAEPERLVVHRVQRRVSTTGGPARVVHRERRYECHIHP
ncbi:MAG: hypothetical protein QOG87_2498 [Actinomycetota bacterium]|jgi:hypothetical protein